MSLAVHHVALNAPDPEAVANALALGAGWDDAGTHDGARWMAAPNLHIAIHRSTGDPAPQPVHQQGIGHLCIQSARPETWHDFAAAGVAWNAPPAPLGTGILYSYGRLPGGALIELEVVPGGEAADRPWVGHVAWVTADIGRQGAFLSTLAGREPHRAGRFQHPSFRAITGHDDVDVEARWLRADNLGLELWRYHHPATMPRPTPAPDAPGWRHVAFEADDLPAERARLEAAGIPLRADGDAFTTEDPDGNRFLIIPPATAPFARASLADSEIAARRG